MSQVTVAACGLFALAMATESAVRLIFLYRLKVRHPRQWAHAAQPVHWKDRTILSARSTVLYLQHRTYLGSSDGAGSRYCGRHRAIMLGAYRLTLLTGFAALITIATHGW